MITVRQVDPGNIDRYEALQAISCWQVTDGGRRILCRAGIAWSGRWWGFLDVEQATAAEGFEIIRALRRWLDQQRVQLYVPVDVARHPSAERLNALLGFVPTDECYEGMRVWKWPI